jgi:hypothetical protein
MSKEPPVENTSSVLVKKNVISRPYLTLVKNSSNAIVAPILGTKSKFNNGNTSNADLTHLQETFIRQ